MGFLKITKQCLNWWGICQKARKWSKWKGKKVLIFQDNLSFLKKESIRHFRETVIVLPQMEWIAVIGPNMDQNIIQISKEYQNDFFLYTSPPQIKNLFITSISLLYWLSDKINMASKIKAAIRVRPFLPS